MNTIKEIQELAAQTDDWTKREVARNLLKAIEGWRSNRAGLDETYRDLHESLTLLVESYPKYPGDLPQSVVHFETILHWSILPKYETEGEFSEGARAHAERIDEYLLSLGIFYEDKNRLWEEIAQKEDN